MSVEQVMSLFELITDYENSQIFSVFYGGYSFVNSDSNILSTFFLSLCDYIIVYKKYQIAAKLSEIISRHMIYPGGEDTNLRNVLEYLNFLTGPEFCAGNALADLRNYINNNYKWFSATIQKAAALSTQQNFYSEKARELKKSIKFEDLYRKFFTGEDLKFSYAICLLDELNVTLKIIYSDSKIVEEVNPGCDDILVLMIRDTLLYVIYPKEEYLMIQSDPNDYPKMLRNSKDSFQQMKNSSTIDLEAANLKQSNSLQTLVKSLLNVYRDQNIFKIQDLLETNTKLNELLDDFLCYHCWKISEYKSFCGHGLCLHLFNDSKSPEFRCPRCNNRNHNNN